MHNLWLYKDGSVIFNHTFLVGRVGQPTTTRMTQDWKECMLPTGLFCEKLGLLIIVILHTSVGRRNSSTILVLWLKNRLSLQVN